MHTRMTALAGCSLIALCVAAAAQEVRPKFVPPGERPESGRWQLGVTASNTDTGVRIDRVISGSAAQRAGLERDDVIVCVDGQQVGRVNGRIVELGRALERAADRQGRANLLVQNRRNKELLNVAVQLDDAFVRPPGPINRVTGTAGYRERLALPPGATLELRIRERGLFGPGRVVAETSTRVFRQPPFSFELKVDPAVLDGSRRYTLEAEIRVSGKVWFETERPVAVLTEGNPTNVDLLLVRR